MKYNKQIAAAVINALTDEARSNAFDAAVKEIEAYFWEAAQNGEILEVDSVEIWKAKEAIIQATEKESRDYFADMYGEAAYGTPTNSLRVLWEMELDNAGAFFFLTYRSTWTFAV